MAMSGSSLLRQLWQRTVVDCFSNCRRQQDDKETIAVAILTEELEGIKKEKQELKDLLAERNESFQLCQQDILKTQKLMTNAIQDLKNLQMKIDEQANILIKMGDGCKSDQKKYNRFIYILKHKLLKKLGQLNDELNENQRLEDMKDNQLEKIQELREENERLKIKYREITENPCACFFSKHVEEYLYSQYITDGECLPATDGDAQPIPQTINDIDGFLPDEEFKIQISEYEYSDLTANSDASTESTSSQDTSDCDIRYINSDASKDRKSSHISSSEEEVVQPRPCPALKSPAAPKVNTDDEDWWLPG